jgi:hypothetical protein
MKLIEGTFDSRTLANMNVALDRVCEKAAGGEDHSVRKLVARQIVKCARGGRTTLSDLTAAGERALIKVVVASPHEANSRYRSPGAVKNFSP